jgi:hypothetical protein
MEIPLHVLQAVDAAGMASFAAADVEGTNLASLILGAQALLQLLLVCSCLCMELAPSQRCLPAARPIMGCQSDQIVRMQPAHTWHLSSASTSLQEQLPGF